MRSESSILVLINLHQLCQGVAPCGQRKGKEEKEHKEEQHPHNHLKNILKSGGETQSSAEINIFDISLQASATNPSSTSSLHRSLRGNLVFTGNSISDTC